MKKLNLADVAILGAAAFVGYMVWRQRKAAAVVPAPPQPVKGGMDWSNVNPPW